MTRPRTYSVLAVEASRLLGKEIRLARKLRRWSESELAGRAGISRYTVQKIERGDMTCALGLVFEAAILVGINLFEMEKSPIASQKRAVDDRLKLLPKSTHRRRRVMDDNF